MIITLDPDKFVFRKLGKSDKDLFIKLRFDYFAMDDFIITDIEKRDLTHYPSRYFDENIETSNFLGMVCEYENDTIAVTYLSIKNMPPNPHFINGRVGTILNVFTYPKYRKQGIATKLISLIIETAKKENICELRLSATKSGENMYKNLGFYESNYIEMKLKISVSH